MRSLTRFVFGSTRVTTPRQADDPDSVVFPEETHDDPFGTESRRPRGSSPDRFWTGALSHRPGSTRCRRLPQSSFARRRTDGDVAVTVVRLHVDPRDRLVGAVRHPISCRSRPRGPARLLADFDRGHDLVRLGVDRAPCSSSRSSPTPRLPSPPASPASLRPETPRSV